MVLDYSNIMNRLAILLSKIDTYDCGQSAGKSSVKSLIMLDQSLLLRFKFFLNIRPKQE